MHALNHVLRSRDLIAKNDAKLSKHRESKQDDILSGDGFLDHGFTRPKVMCLLCNQSRLSARWKAY
ncbi:hypothetical protein QJS10_CPA06g00766 [Acorus calamus]|uniref:UTP25 NTP hydrolase-like domain-containing protein n=1 Tax=Acorus calamus TaxID=4465 RepID=A0AAV9EM06_ACOCL|nr:hypothetical protein QJS10_CPA06g00766 [Acorus calamus]